MLFPRLFQRCCTIVAVLLAASVSVHALTPKDYAVQLSATVKTDSPRITLSWDADGTAAGYVVLRKVPSDIKWKQRAVLPGGASSFADAKVEAGAIYEYYVKKFAPGRVARGYIATSIDYPLVEDRGDVLLIVESSIAPDLATEIDQLTQDMTGDGWTVIRHDVESTATVTSVKNWIVSRYNAAPDQTKAVFLLGHVPVPYSGDFAPDGHPEHKGAWPADTYYADVTGTWTDVKVHDKKAARKANWNVPGDGKFDQSRIPGRATLAVGRVDLSGMSLFFPQTETDLMRQYLNRDHAFRTGQLSVNQRALIDDNFGTLNGQPFAESAWSDFSALLGEEKISTGDWQTKASAGSYLMAYGCGAGYYGWCNGVGDSKTFVSTKSYAVFTMLLGSYFGDWDNDGNFLRVMLANGGYGLTCAWSGRPQWVFHYMGIGFPIGYCTKLSENNRSTYSALTFKRGVHMGLMGDPTLRMTPVLPPSDLTGTLHSGSGVVLSWTASPDDVLGYAIYRAQSPGGPFVRLNDSLATDTNYPDANGVSGDVYMVRAVKRETTNSGSYFNASQGIFASNFVTQP